MTTESGETVRRLAGMTDEGVFERLATAVLRLTRAEYHALAHPGVNADGKTVVAPVDGIAIVPSSDPPHLVAAQHTTCAREKLRGKWLNASNGDLPKTAAILTEERKRTPNACATLALTTNRDPAHDLLLDVAAKGRMHNMSVDVWSASRLAHVLDHTADGQWVRRQHLGLLQQRLSRALLKELSGQCVRDYPHLFDDPARWVERTLDDELRRAVEDARDVLFLVAGSGLGKSSACYGLLCRHVERGGYGLVVPHDIVIEAVSPDGAVDILLRRLCPSLESGCGAAAFDLCTPDKPMLIVIEDVNKAAQPALVIERLAGWAAAGRRDTKTGDAGMLRPSWRLVCPVWPQVLTALREDTRKFVDALSLYVGALTPKEGSAAVQRRAAMAGASLSDLQATAVADALGLDPLLIALRDAGDGEDTSDPNRVMESFVTGSLQRLSDSQRSSFTGSDLRHALRTLATLMLEQRRLAPTWSELRTWLSGDNDMLAMLNAVGRHRELFRLEQAGATERLAFRHDRVRDWLLADGLAALMHEDRVPHNVLADPFWAEAVGTALVIAPYLFETWADRVRAANPLALFHAFRLFADPATPFRHSIMAAIHTWMAAPLTHGPANQHLRWEAQVALAATDRLWYWRSPGNSTNGLGLCWKRGSAMATCLPVWLIAGDWIQVSIAAVAIVSSNMCWLRMVRPYSDTLMASCVIQHLPRISAVGRCTSPAMSVYRI
jgi:hypothetical protein